MINPANYLIGGDLMATRLQEKIPTLPAINIRHAMSLEWVIKNPLHKSINIIFFDDVPDESATGRAQLNRTQASEQLWLVLVSLRNVANQGESALQESSALVGQVLNWLQGVVLSRDHEQLARKKCPYRKTDRDGFVHYPMLFSTRIYISGQLPP